MEEILNNFDLGEYALGWNFTGQTPSTLITYPHEWQKFYFENNYIASDPVIAVGLVASDWVHWDSLPNNKVLRDAADYGLTSGIIIPFGFRGQRGILSVSDPKLGGKAIAQLQGNLSEALRVRDVLTEKQIAVLALLAEGYTAAKAAQLLGITHNTLNDHLKSARRRTGIANTGALLSAATSCGII